MDAHAEQFRNQKRGPRQLKISGNDQDNFWGSGGLTRAGVSESERGQESKGVRRLGGLWKDEEDGGVSPSFNLH